MSLKDILQDRIVNPVARSVSTITTVGVVTDSDENNNTCSVQYVDKEGKKRNKNNVAVRLYGSGTDWFPAVDDNVVIEDSDDACIIIARHVSNYNIDVRSRMALQNDVFSDGEGSWLGGQIF